MVSIAQSESASFDFTSVCAVVTGGPGASGLRPSPARCSPPARPSVICGRHEPEAPVASPGPTAVSETAVFVEADVREAAEVTAVIDVACTHSGASTYSSTTRRLAVDPAATASPRFAPRSWPSTCSLPSTAPQAANAVFQEQESGGVIVNIGSVSGMRPHRAPPRLRRRQGGTESTSPRPLAIEWAPKVRVNCLSAGLLDYRAGIEYYGGTEGLARVAATVAARRMGHTGRRGLPPCLFLGVGPGPLHQPVEPRSARRRRGAPPSSRRPAGDGRKVGPVAHR